MWTPFLDLGRTHTGPGGCPWCTTSALRSAPRGAAVGGGGGLTSLLACRGVRATLAGVFNLLLKFFNSPHKIYTTCAHTPAQGVDTISLLLYVISFYSIWPTTTTTPAAPGARGAPSSAPLRANFVHHIHPPPCGAGVCPAQVQKGGPHVHIFPSVQSSPGRGTSAFASCHPVVTVCHYRASKGGRVRRPQPCNVSVNPGGRRAHRSHGRIPPGTVTVRSHRRGRLQAVLVPNSHQQVRLHYRLSRCPHHDDVTWSRYRLCKAPRPAPARTQTVVLRPHTVKGSKNVGP